MRIERVQHANPVILHAIGKRSRQPSLSKPGLRKSRNQTLSQTI